MPQRTKKRIPLVGRVVVALLVALVLYPVLAFADVAARGPYVTWFNERCLRVAEEAALLGAEPRDVESALGRPSSIWTYDSPTDLAGTPRPDAERFVTYNYAPHAWIPGGAFQVHFRNGRVVGFEMFDD